RGSSPTPSRRCPFRPPSTTRAISATSAPPRPPRWWTASAARSTSSRACTRTASSTRGSSAELDAGLSRPPGHRQGRGGDMRELGYHKLVLSAFPFNTAGVALYERLGFRTVGVYQEQGLLDGRWVDTIIMERLL